MGNLVFIVGPPFSGKTSSSGTFPKPMVYLDWDGSFDVFKKVKKKDGSLLVPDWEKIKEVKLFVRGEYIDMSVATARDVDFKSGKFPEYTKHAMDVMTTFNTAMKEVFANPPKSLVIDSATSMFRVWKDAIMFSNKVPALRISDYGTLEGMLYRQFLPTLQTLKEKVDWIILIGHETADKDELLGAITEFPIGLSQAQGRMMAKEFDEVWRQKVEGGEYLWRTRNHGLFVGAGSRNSFPDPVKPATFQELEKYLK